MNDAPARAAGDLHSAPSAADTWRRLEARCCLRHGDVPHLAVIAAGQVTAMVDTGNGLAARQSDRQPDRQFRASRPNRPGPDPRHNARHSPAQPGQHCHQRRRASRPRRQARVQPPRPRAAQIPPAPGRQRSGHALRPRAQLRHLSEPALLDGVYLTNGVSGGSSSRSRRTGTGRRR